MCMPRNSSVVRLTLWKLSLVLWVVIYTRKLTKGRADSLSGRRFKTRLELPRFQTSRGELKFARNTIVPVEYPSMKAKSNPDHLCDFIRGNFPLRRQLGAFSAVIKIVRSRSTFPKKLCVIKPPHRPSLRSRRRYLQRVVFLQHQSCLIWMMCRV